MKQIKGNKILYGGKRKKLERQANQNKQKTVITKELETDFYLKAN